MGFSRQEDRSGWSCPPPRDLPDPGIEPTSLCLLHWQAGSWPLEPPGKPAHRCLSANLCLPLHLAFSFCEFVLVSAFYKATAILASDFPYRSVGKEFACNVGDLGSIPGLGRSAGEGKGYPLSILAWRIPWTVESTGLQRVGHDWATLTYLCRALAVVPWSIAKTHLPNKVTSSWGVGDRIQLGRYNSTHAYSKFHCLASLWNIIWEKVGPLLLWLLYGRLTDQFSSVVPLLTV